ncbi:GntR family transcriptional regulator [Streptomyces coeruleoprunus]|uniref:GntR family transcriptional regulator n=1 Tax=Streptomyces coeruleoprunus TaxID=285563 RepID=A0ABV9X6Y3_9ACTN
MTVDLEGPEPLYEQIAAVLTARIADGTYAPRRRVPSEAAICGEFKVSRPTARAAVQLLSKQGLIITVRGKGSFVAEQPTLPSPEDGESSD